MKFGQIEAEHIELIAETDLEKLGLLALIELMRPLAQSIGTKEGGYAIRLLHFKFAQQDRRDD